VGKCVLFAATTRTESCVVQCAYRISRGWEWEYPVNVCRTGKQTVDLNSKKSAPEDTGEKPVQRHVVHFRVHAPQMPGADVSALSSISPEN
jgi:hypothetical protein